MIKFSEALRGNPIIAAVRDEQYLQKAVASSCKIVFLLKGNICTIEETVKQVQGADKKIFLHIDLLEGFGKDKYSLQYIKERIVPDGIISTRSGLIKIAKDFAIPAIQRVFLIDRLSFETGIESIRQIRPDAVEIMPGIMPTLTAQICRAVSVPVITGGLISEREDVVNSLKAGALGVSTSTLKIWEMRGPF